jgi:hypothetical protein
MSTSTPSAPTPPPTSWSADELAGVDKVISLGRLPVVERDLTAAGIVSRYVKDGRRDFILVNKVGAHFPVHDKYPDSYMRYRPALPRGRFLNVSDTGSRAGFGGSAEEWRQYRNAYRNTLAWNVGRLLRPACSAPASTAPRSSTRRTTARTSTSAAAPASTPIAAPIPEWRKGRCRWC